MLEIVHFTFLKTFMLVMDVKCMFSLEICDKQSFN